MGGASPTNTVTGVDLGLNLPEDILLQILQQLRPGAVIVRGSGFRVQGSGSRVQGSGFRVQGLGFRVQGSEFRLQGSGLRGWGALFRSPANRPSVFLDSDGTHPGDNQGAKGPARTCDESEGEEEEGCG